jgi:endothelin-converting enzyme
VERLLHVALADEAEQEAKKAQPIISSSLIEQSDPEVWPPWPWPPWGDDNGPDKDKDKDKDKPKINKTHEAHKLAKAVVEFETKLAKASLDLYVRSEDYMGPVC